MTRALRRRTQPPETAAVDSRGAGFEQQNTKALIDGTCRNLRTLPSHVVWQLILAFLRALIVIVMDRNNQRDLERGPIGEFRDIFMSIFF
jgi:hypothetical protein